MKKRIDELEPYIRALPKCFILHSVNVGKYVQMMADELCRFTNTKNYSYMKLPIPDKAYLIGRYHDIGKSGISNELWQKTLP